MKEYLIQELSIRELKTEKIFKSSQKMQNHSLLENNYDLKASTISLKKMHQQISDIVTQKNEFFEGKFHQNEILCSN